MASIGFSETLPQNERGTFCGSLNALDQKTELIDRMIQVSVLELEGWYGRENLKDLLVFRANLSG